MYPDIPPFTLWFRADSGLEVMTADVILLSAFAMADLAELLREKGVRVTWESRQDDLFPPRQPLFTCAIFDEADF